MDKFVYVMLLEKTKIYKKMNMEAVIKHVDNIRNLDDRGDLVLCGPFKGYLGMAGMIILRAESLEAAEEFCKSEPLVVLGFVTYKLSTLQVGDRENNYLL